MHGLRDTYERWLADDEPLDAVEAAPGGPDRGDDRRARRGRRRTSEALAPAVAASPCVVDRLIALRGFRWGDDLTPAEQALLPEPADWVPARPLVDALVAALARAGAAPVLARTPVRLRRPGDPRRVRAPTPWSPRSAQPRRWRRSTPCSPLLVAARSRR